MPGLLVDPDLLAELVFKAKNSNCLSLRSLRNRGTNPFPKKGPLMLFLDSRDQAVCIVEITKGFRSAFSSSVC